MKILNARNIAQTAQNHVRNLLHHVGPRTDQSHAANIGHVTKGLQARSMESLKQEACRDHVSDKRIQNKKRDRVVTAIDPESGLVQDTNPGSSSLTEIESLRPDPDGIQSNPAISLDHEDSQPPLERVSDKKSTSSSSSSQLVPRNKSALTLPAISPRTTFTNSGQYIQDLKRLLDVIGSDPKETRYWFRYFQKITTSVPLFAVVQIEEEVLEASQAIHRDTNGKYDLSRESPLSELCGYLAFLQRHDMKCVIVHGRTTSVNNHKDSHMDIVYDNQLITELLEKYGVKVRQTGVPPIHAKQDRNSSMWSISHIDPHYLSWVQSSDHIPILCNMSLTPDRRLTEVEPFFVTSALSLALKPLKVLLVNTEGGLVDQDGKVIPNINLPHEKLAACRSPWCTDSMKNKIHDISGLLSRLQDVQLGCGKMLDTAVIITSCNTLLTELFTHHGSGTFFKITEKINAYHSLDDIDIERLTSLIQMAFGRELRSDFIHRMADSVDTIFISEGYSSAAIVTKEPGIAVPYLDKFVVRKDQQDNCVGHMLWQQIIHTYPQLFWRSRNVNLINPWYFKRSEGSWSDGEWTVFWYGIQQHRLTSVLIDYALSKYNSFKASDPNHMVVKSNDKSMSQWSALKYM